MTDTSNKSSQAKTAKQTKYVVVRDGRRVSPEEYVDQESAASEYGYWQELVQKWDPSSRVEVVEKNEKKHRIY
jgi:hypothetical protein